MKPFILPNLNYTSNRLVISIKELEEYGFNNTSDMFIFKIVQINPNNFILENVETNTNTIIFDNPLYSLSSITMQFKDLYGGVLTWPRAITDTGVDISINPVSLYTHIINNLHFNASYTIMYVRIATESNITPSVLNPSVIEGFTTTAPSADKALIKMINSPLGFDVSNSVMYRRVNTTLSQEIILNGAIDYTNIKLNMIPWNAHVVNMTFDSIASTTTVEIQYPNGIPVGTLASGNLLYISGINTNMPAIDGAAITTLQTPAPLLNRTLNNVQFTVDLGQIYIINGAIDYTATPIIYMQGDHTHAQQSTISNITISNSILTVTITNGQTFYPIVDKPIAFWNFTTTTPIADKALIDAVNSITGYKAITVTYTSEFLTLGVYAALIGAINYTITAINEKLDIPVSEPVDKITFNTVQNPPNYSCDITFAYNTNIDIGAAVQLSGFNTVQPTADATAITYLNNTQLIVNKAYDDYEAIIQGNFPRMNGDVVYSEYFTLNPEGAAFQIPLEITYIDHNDNLQ